ncbi:DUF5105 domain-containing protein [Priestia megaterium]|uniref:DUF5105 domain-containing protein n=1 Tax=Priestia megaterium TaxID=1404 RepID=UPI003D2D3157
MNVLALAFVLMLVLAACNSSKETGGSTSAKNKAIEASIDSASYILVDSDEGATSEEKGLLKVDLKVKNVSKNSISLSDYDGVYLYEGDEQLSPKTGVNSRELGLESSASDKIGAGKQKDLTFVFEVKKDKKYKIGLQPKSSDYDEEIDEVTLTLDTKKYAKSYNKLQDPEKALQAYTEVLYLNKENVDYDKYVTADKTAVIEEQKKAFNEELKGAFSNSLTDKAKKDFFNMYKDVLKEKASVKTNVIANANNKAVVEVEYTTLNLSDLYSYVSQLKRAYTEETKDYDTEHSEEFAASHFKDIVNELETKEGSRPLRIFMVKEDGKWTVKPSDLYSDSLGKTFGSSYIR